MDQHTPEWWQARLGKVTASRITDVIARTQRGQYTARREKYLKEKVAERVVGRPRDRKRVASLDERRDLEPDARAAYQFYYECELQVVGFIDHPRIPNAGASPDALVDSDGGLEIKCLDAEGHLEVIRNGVFEEDYVDQCHFNIICTGRQWWDLAAFNPDVPEEYRLFVQRVTRTNTPIITMESEVIEFLAEVDQRVAQLQGIVTGKSALTSMLERSLDGLRVH